MTTFVALIWRELVMLGLLTAVGSGVACWPRDLPPIVRIALAPALGVAVASCVLMTAGWFLPMRIAAWVIFVPLTLASTWYAVREVRRRGGLSVSRADWVRLVLAVTIPLLAVNAPLAARGSLGPINYTLADEVGYVSGAQGIADHAMRGENWGPAWDLVARFAEDYTANPQHIGEMVFPAAANSLFFWDATTTQSAVSIVFLLATALGLFGIVRMLVRVPNLDVLAAALAAGPVFFVLLINGSQATLAGQAVLLPFAFFGQRALARGDRRDVVVCGLLAAAVQTLFSTIVPAATLAGVGVLGVTALVAWRRGKLTRPAVRSVAVGVGLVLLLAIVFSPVSFVRNLELWRQLLTGTAIIAYQPYDLRIQLLPAWLLGAREFFTLSGAADRNDWWQVYLLPWLLLALIAFALVRNASLRLYATVFAASAVVALYSTLERACPYCVERNLVAVEPLVVLGLVAGVGAVWRIRSRWARPASIAVVLIVVLVVGNSASIVARRGYHAATMFPSEAREVAAAATEQKGTILLEGLSSSPEAVSELPTVYQAVYHATGGDRMLAIDTEHQQNAGLVYLALGAVFDPPENWTADYGLVYTRVPGIKTNRQTILQRGPFALQRRTSPFDVSVTTGLWVDRAKRDPKGTAYLMPAVGPFEFWVAAQRPDPVYVHFAFAGKGAEAVQPPAGVVVERKAGGRLDLCVPAPGRGSKRVVKLNFTSADATLIASDYPYDRMARSAGGPALAQMEATTRPCRRAAGL